MECIVLKNLITCLYRSFLRFLDETKMAQSSSKYASQVCLTFTLLHAKAEAKVMFDITDLISLESGEYRIYSYLWPPFLQMTVSLSILQRHLSA